MSSIANAMAICLIFLKLDKAFSAIFFAAYLIMIKIETSPLFYIGNDPCVLDKVFLKMSKKEKEKLMFF